MQFGLVFLGCLLFLDALVGEKGLVENLKARQDFQALERSLARLRGENERLRTDVELLRKDPSTIEDVARRELGMMKPGEKLFIIRDAEPPQPLARPFTLPPARGKFESLSGRRRRVQHLDAGWSSPVARWAHNPKVAGSNPAPATTFPKSTARIPRSRLVFPTNLNNRLTNR